MYKFEITASSMKELEMKQHEFARSFLDLDKPVIQETGPAIPSTTLPTIADAIPANLTPVMPVPNVSPTTNSVPGSSTPSNQSLDSRGLPWDVRIHSSSREQIGNGSWKYRRGVDKAVVATVEQENLARLKQAGPADLVPAPAAPIPAMPPTPSHVPPAVLPNFAQPVAPPVEVAQPVAVQPSYAAIPAPTTVLPSHSINTFKANFMEVIAKLIEDKKIDQAYIQQLCQYFQIKEIWNVLGDELKLYQLFDVFVQAGFFTKVEG